MTTNPDNRRALLVVAHGSRNSNSNGHFAELIGRWRQELIIKTDEDLVLSHAFLEFASPDIARALDELRRRRLTRIHLLPYFLSPGNHIQRDIPEIVDRYRTLNPELEVVILPYLGARDTTMITAMNQIIEPFGLL